MNLEPFTNTYLPCDVTVAGAGYGGRLELGRFHLGASGFYGQGLGLKYALEVSEAAQDRKGNLRKSKGVHVQARSSSARSDLFAGWRDRADRLDRLRQAGHGAGPSRPDESRRGRCSRYTIIKHQMGVNAGLVYNVSPNLHIDLDFFRAEAKWYVVNGLPEQKQVVWVGNAGMTISW